MLFLGYKDNSFFARAFVFFSMLRGILWVLVLALLYEYPLLQICLLCFMSLTVLLLIIIKRPFNKKLSILEFSIYEIMILLVHSCILALGIMDYMGIEAQEAREELGTAMIIGFTAFGIIGLVFMGLSFITGVISGIKSFKKMKAAGSVNFILLLTIPFASYGMDFEDISGPEELKKQKSFKPKSLRQVVPLEKLQEDIGNKSQSKMEASTFDNLDNSAIVFTRTRGTLRDTTSSFAHTKIHSAKAEEKQVVRDIFEEKDKFPQEFTKPKAKQFLDSPTAIDANFNPTSTKTTMDRTKKAASIFEEERRQSIIRGLFSEDEINRTLNNLPDKPLNEGKNSSDSDDSLHLSRENFGDTGRSFKYLLSTERNLSRFSPERAQNKADDVEEFQL